MELQPIRSDSLAAVGYDDKTSTLYVEFRHGGLYAYHEVPAELYAELLAAQPHPWTQLAERVKSHRYTVLS
ncbi:KTSC domain-containing protein [Saxibacter everestensis]|uniref:KTSC domain-containing protein n=1 Tax=Saxibacter everestensis TaxID=2909229 RepID=A0ABY8QSC9_9MICO|nr:KTSC domain-containing protein [Brevibacteriaceae bacterium ZFBP1038]